MNPGPKTYSGTKNNTLLMSILEICLFDRFGMPVGI